MVIGKACSFNGSTGQDFHIICLSAETEGFSFLFIRMGIGQDTFHVDDCAVVFRKKTEIFQERIHIAFP